MITPVAAVFIASLLGSTHCAGMCGAFLAMAVAPAQRSGSRSVLLGAYNGGRLVTYLALGAVAGAAGAAVDLGGSMVGIQRAAMVAAGAFMLAFGVVGLLRAFNVAIGRAPVPALLRKAVIRAHRAADGLPPVLRSFTIGLLTTLLPCGWLWAFVITASGTGSVLYGPVVMGAFWLGTLPVMLSLGLGIQTLAGRLGDRLPLLTSVLLIAVGVSTMAGRIAAPVIDGRASRQAHRDDGSLAIPDPRSKPPCPVCHPSEDHDR